LKTIPSGVFNFSVVGALAWMPARISLAANKKKVGQLLSLFLPFRLLGGVDYINRAYTSPMINDYS
jgi:hypothetical protein